MNFGNLLLNNGDTKGAISKLNKAIEINENNPNIFNDIGIAYEKNGQIEESIQSFKKAIEINPQFAFAYFNLGNTLRKLGNNEQAILNYKKAITIDINRSDFYQNLGVTLEEVGILEESIDNLRAAIAINPNNPSLYFNLANSFFSKGKIQESLENYQKSLLIKPEYAEASANIYLPIKIMNLTDKPLENLLYDFSKKTLSSYLKIDIEIIKYRLKQGQLSTKNTIKKINKFISSEIIDVKNPDFKNYKKSEKLDLEKKIIALVSFGRSGTGFLHSLIDNHPEVSTL